MRVRVRPRPTHAYPVRPRCCCTHCLVFLLVFLLLLTVCAVLSCGYPFLSFRLPRIFIMCASARAITMLHCVLINTTRVRSLPLALFAALTAVNSANCIEWRVGGRRCKDAATITVGNSESNTWKLLNAATLVYVCVCVCEKKLKQTLNENCCCPLNRATGLNVDVDAGVGVGIADDVLLLLLLLFDSGLLRGCCCRCCCWVVVFHALHLLISMSVYVCVFILSRNWFLFAFFAVSLNVPLCCCHTMKIPTHQHTHIEACISLYVCILVYVCEYYSNCIFAKFIWNSE